MSLEQSGRRADGWESAPADNSKTRGCVMIHEDIHVVAMADGQAPVIECQCISCLRTLFETSARSGLIRIRCRRCKVMNQFRFIENVMTVGDNGAIDLARRL